MKLKKITVALIALILVLSLFGCGSDLNKDVIPPSVSDSGVVDVDKIVEPGTENSDKGKDSGDQVTYTEAKILSAGDIIFHMPEINSAFNTSTGKYDFTDIFQYITPLVSQSDYSVANFEAALGGSSTYSGFPAFNTPDSTIDAIVGAGFDMMLYANNHSYDQKLAGVKRTVSHIKSSGIDFLGAKESLNDTSYKIVEINGIKVGMLNYADDLGSGTVNRTINGASIPASDLPYIDLFTKGLLPEFYSDVSKRIADLKSKGADFIIFYIHWGTEYIIDPTGLQKTVAQKLCDLGVDAIIGSHPHLVQPVETLTSTDGTRNTICFYSLGNLVSNQCRNTLSADYCHGNNVNTENGLIVTLTIRKYSSGKCLISNINTTPTWVHRYKCSDGYYDYRIIPLFSEVFKNPTAYGLNDSSTGEKWASEALDMTEKLLGDSVKTFNSAITLPYTK